ncbi:MarR family winged helix-turn-helix transcriptional regulator [Metabacillus malikii]|uniref:MarR family 2-MHQ and catechol resistance regulon transcriptional repressor n=1 Tax=Metabacillus malikii TaxID=1504265 RepID=A0ABT9ZHS4_9BACI|nr:MarR family transcriptional regulator [Metabacillus malikii]MDQ0231833.1 MarR family 2-MHQ and catechol resistance regulon transcriptional repressor [Metabacillus malikii]
MKLASEELKAVTVLLRTSQAIQEVIRKDVASYGLNPTEFSVLELLYHKGDQPTQLIGKKVLISSSSITYVVDKLEQKNYVKRKGCPKDRRVIYAVLTSKGKALMDEIFPKHENKLKEVFETINVDDLKQMSTFLKQVGYKATSI